MDAKFRNDNWKVIEIWVLISGIVPPVFVYFWLQMNPQMSAHLKWWLWIAALQFTLLVLMKYCNSYIRDHLEYFLYGGYYFASAIVIYVTYYYNFSTEYLIFLLMMVFFVTLTFEKMLSLLIYLGDVLALVSLAVYSGVHYQKFNIDNGILLITCFIILLIIGSFNLFIREKSRRDLYQSRDDYQRLLDVSPEGIIVYERDTIVYVNEAFTKMITGVKKEDIIGKSALELLHPKDYEQNLAKLKEVLEGKVTGYIEERLEFANNKTIDVESISLLTTYKGNKAVMAIIRDITERKRLERELVDAEVKYRSIVEAALVGVFIFQKWKLVYVNKYFEDTFGYNSREIYDIDYLNLVFEESKGKVIDAMQKLESGTKDMVMEVKGRKSNGSVVYLQTHVRSIHNSGPPTIYGTMLDITERKLSEERVREMALYDPLTGLPNRYYLELHIEEVIERSKDSGEPVALMFIDFDRFKIINDTKGHMFGDALLKKVSKEIETCLAEKDFLSRYAGDEFIIVLEDTGRKRAGEVAENIINVFSDSIDVENRKVNITPSIGISFYPMDSHDMETLIKNADTAMYEAKSQGRNNYQFYEQQMGNGLSKKVQMEGALRKALQNNEFTIHYQPLVNIMTGDIYGAEALLRWNNPELGFIPPDEFIPIAEETGLIIPIGEWVLRTVCMQCMAWRKAGLGPFNMSVNVSYKQLKFEGFIHSVQEILKESGLEPQFLELELTESILKDAEELKIVLDNLKPIGVKLAIDDFGVGYSSLSMLKNVSINNLKIDKSFIWDMLDNPVVAALVRTIIDIGKNLNYDIIAEGIETKAQLDFLKKNNCDFGQGYYFSKPLNEKSFEELYREW